MDAKKMQLSTRQMNRLRTIIDMAEKILADAASAPPASRPSGNKGPATRRRGKDLIAFKKIIKAERKNGASIAQLAKKHRVTPSYLYQMR